MNGCTSKEEKDSSQSKENTGAQSREEEEALKLLDTPGTLTNSHGLGDRGYVVGKLGRELPCAKPGPRKGTPQGKGELGKNPPCQETQHSLRIRWRLKSLLCEFVATNCLIWLSA